MHFVVNPHVALNHCVTNTSMPDIVSDAISPQLDQLRAEVDLSLDRYTHFDGECPEKLRSAIRYSLLAPGKRLRPCLVLLASEACGQQYSPAFPAACAVEMVHAYSLIHDDLPAMDDDDIRRGQPTCHKQFDEATAILAGDALLALAFQVIAQDVPSPAVAVRCLHELALTAGACNLVGGQVADLTAEFSDLDAEALAAIHRRKTGAMFRVSLRLGGIIAQASNEHIHALNTYGEKLGLAFQITDDLLDVAGEEAAVGKRVGKDAVQGKLTYPGLLGVTESRNLATTLIQDACDAIGDLGESATSLTQLARFVLARNK